jgi:hypothetical protein
VCTAHARSYSFAVCQPRVSALPRCPGQRVVIASELGHRFGDPHEPVWGTQVPTRQCHDRVDVTVQDGETLARVAGRERVVAWAEGDRLSIGSDPFFSERTRVADGVDLEEVLVGEAESDHPRGQFARIGDPRITRQRVHGQQLSRYITDQSGGVICMQDHLDDMADCALQ